MFKFKIKKYIKATCFLLFFVALGLFLMEYGYRCLLVSKKKIAALNINPIDYAEPTLGWGPQVKRAGSGKYELLFLGDSFSQSYPDEIKLFYYDHIRRLLPGVSTITIACGGYGTAQEYLAMKKYMHTTPNMIVLQMCSNDLINNVWKYDSVEHCNTKAFYFRPYYEKDKFILRFSYPYGLGIENFSWLYCFIISNMVNGANWGAMNTDSEAQQVTLALLRLIKKEYPNIPIFVFTVNSCFESYYKSLVCIPGCFYIAGVYQYVEDEAKKNNVTYLHKDNTHWNAYGHKKAGEYIANYLLTHGYVK